MVFALYKNGVIRKIRKATAIRNQKLGKIVRYSKRLSTIYRDNPHIRVKYGEAKKTNLRQKHEYYYMRRKYGLKKRR